MYRLWGEVDFAHCPLSWVQPNPNEVDIITHSLGGAVALAWVAIYHPQIKIRFFALDSPINGCSPSNGKSVCDDASAIGALFLGAQGPVFQEFISADTRNLLQTGRKLLYGDGGSNVASGTLYVAANQQDLVVSAYSATPDEFQAANVTTGLNGHFFPLSDCYPGDDKAGCHGTVLQNVLIAGWVAGTISSPSTSIQSSPLSLQALNIDPFTAAFVADRRRKL